MTLLRSPSCSFLGGLGPAVEFILGALSLCPSPRLHLRRQDLGGYAVCHSACETDTKSFSCDLFELMVQNIVKHPAHPEAISKVHWADTNGPVVYLRGPNTHARPSHIHMSVHMRPYTNHICPKSRRFPPEAPAVLCHWQSVINPAECGILKQNKTKQKDDHVCVWEIIRPE